MSRSTYQIMLAGDVDLHRRDELSELTQGFVASQRADVAVLMGDVTFLDSIGLSFLIQLRTIADARDGEVRIVDAPASVLRLLRLVSLDGRFELATTG